MQCLPDMRVRLAGGVGERELASDIAFAVGAQKVASDALGFVPKAGVERHARTGRLALIERNNDRVGFCLFGTTKPTARVFQLWVRDDARRIQHGRALTAFVCDRASRRGCHVTLAKVARDLFCLPFWYAIGFHAIEIGPGGDRRGRWVITFARNCFTLGASQLREIGALPADTAEPTLDRVHHHEATEAQTTQRWH